MFRTLESIFWSVVVALVLALTGLALMIYAMPDSHQGARAVDGGKYLGQLVSGVRHGQGSVIWPNGVRYVGGFNNGLFAGYGQLTMPSGQEYQGEFDLGLPAGAGRLTDSAGGVFVGTFRNGVLDGQGKFDNGNGSVYEGEFKNNTFDGQGKYLTPGSVYQGEFRRGEMTGKGKYVFDNGTIYEGAVEKGSMHGQGRFQYPAGPVYQGEFVRDQFTGKGVATWPDGRKHEGQFKNWQPEGEGTFTDGEGNRYSGVFNNNGLTGKARIERADGTRYDGEVENWLAHGEGTLFLANGDVYTGHFAYGQYDGEGILKYAQARSDGRIQDSGSWSYGRQKAHQEEEKRRDEQNVEQALYQQTNLLDKALASLSKRNAHAINLFLLAIGGDGGQEVFRREVDYVSKLFDSRYGTAGHSLVLANSRATAGKQPLATTTSIRQALAAMGAKMNKEQDILFLFMTSHGAKNKEFSLDLPGLRLPNLHAGELADMLRESGIKWRVLVISSCYSGGFIEGLKDENTLLITATSSDRRSFGCADDNEFTYFGRAFFREALPKSASITEAFDKAQQLIQDWEEEDHADGNSDASPISRLAKAINQTGTKPAEKAHQGKETARNKKEQAAGDFHSEPQMVSSPAILRQLQLWQAQLPAAKSSTTATPDLPTVDERIQAAKQQSSRPEVAEYLCQQVLPVIQAELNKAMTACSKSQIAPTKAFTLVANIRADGSFQQIATEPRHHLAICVSHAAESFRMPPPPPGNDGAGLAFELEVAANTELAAATKAAPQ